MSSGKVKGQNWEANKVMTSSRKVLFNPYFTQGGYDLLKISNRKVDPYNKVVRLPPYP